MKCLVCGRDGQEIEFRGWGSWLCPICGEVWLVCTEGLRKWNPEYNGWDVAKEGCMRVEGVL